MIEIGGRPIFWHPEVFDFIDGDQTTWEREPCGDKSTTNSTMSCLIPQTMVAMATPNDTKLRQRKRMFHGIHPMTATMIAQRLWSVNTETAGIRFSVTLAISWISERLCSPAVARQKEGFPPAELP